jgi:predicted metalloprotease with PDZ domain
LIGRTLLAAAFAFPVAPQAQTRIEYDISFPKAAQHEARVVVTFRGIPPGRRLEAKMSRSSPGRYAPSNFAKNVYDVSAADGRGRPLSIERPDAHSWAVARHDGTVRISYTVWGDRVDGTYLGIDHSHAHINMPAAFMYATGMDSTPISLTIHPRTGWKIATQLAPTRDPLTFTAPNYQYFLDSPIEVGPITTRSWNVQHGGKTSTIRLAIHHLGTESQVDSFAVLARSVIDESVALWGELPGFDYGTYTFIIDYLPWAGGDGMEHRNSTVITSRNTLADHRARTERLGTFTHEFFHAWNIERLRPKALEPFDFGGENMSSELWLGEGFSNYGRDLIIRRAGFYTDEEFARIIGGALIDVIESPARKHGSAADMSRLAPFFDGSAFPDPVNRQNIFLTYYTWGSVIGLGLDLTLRQKYNATLDDYLRLLWNNFGRRQTAAFAPARPFTQDDLRAELGRLTRDTAFANDFFRRFIDGREVPDFAKLLEPAGFRLVTGDERPYLGASMDNDTSRVFVNWTQEGGSVHEAGISSGDLIYSIDGVPTPSIDSLEAVIRRYKAGDVVRVDVYQRKTRRTVPMTIRTRRPMQIATFESLGVPVPASVLEFRKSWLGSKRSSPATRD